MQIHATGAQRLVNTYARANKDLTRLLESWDPVQLTALVHFLTEASSIVAAFTEFTELTEFTDKITVECLYNLYSRTDTGEFGI